MVKGRLRKIGILILLFGLYMPTIFIQENKYRNCEFFEEDLNLITTSNPDLQEIIWNETWGGPNSDFGWSIWGDGIYLYTVGNTYSYGAGSSDLMLVKWYTNGSIAWSKTWGYLQNDYGRAVWGDGNYIYTVGETESIGAGFYDFILIKWDTNGNILDSNTWGGPLNDYGYSIWGDSTYLYTVGDTYSYGAGSSDIVLVKWNKDLMVSGYYTWGGVNIDTASSVWVDGSYVYTVGRTESYGAGGRDFILIKWYTNGAIAWSRTWGYQYHDFGYSVYGDGNYIYTVGETESNDHPGYYDFALVKWDGDGNKIWKKTWGGTSSDCGSAVWIEGNYIYTLGDTYSYGNGNSDFALVKWDLNGKVILSSTWGGSGDDFGRDIWSDEKYVYTFGRTYSYGEGSCDYVLIKCGIDSDCDGVSDTIEESIYFTDPNNPDSDNDGLNDGAEINTYATDPNDIDSDNDLMPDGWEVINGLNPLSDDSSADLDNDNLSNLEEYTYSTDPNKADTDEDGFSDYDEIFVYSTDPNNFFSNPVIVPTIVYTLIGIFTLLLIIVVSKKVTKSHKKKKWRRKEAERLKLQETERKVKERKEFERKQAEEKIKKEKEDMLRRIELENQNIVNQAYSKFQAELWDEAILLFNKSKELCSQQGWREGVNYAGRMISECEKFKLRAQLEKERREKLKMALQVSNRIKMEVVRDALEMDSSSFNKQIIQWANEYGFKIDGDYLLIKDEDKDPFIIDLVKELDRKFKEWGKAETEKIGKM